MIEQLLAEIDARAAKATAKEDTVVRRMARIKQRTDIPRLVAALRLAVEVLEEMERPAYKDSELPSLMLTMRSRAKHANTRIAAALKGVEK